MSQSSIAFKAKRRNPHQAPPDPVSARELAVAKKALAKGDMSLREYQDYLAWLRGPDGRYHENPLLLIGNPPGRTIEQALGLLATRERRLKKLISGGAPQVIVAAEAKLVKASRAEIRSLARRNPRGKAPTRIRKVKGGWAVEAKATYHDGSTKWLSAIPWVIGSKSAAETARKKL
jgi:hypothetical protein